MLYDELFEYFGNAKVWKQFCEFFCCLPFAAVINDKIFCVHAGIEEELIVPEQINLIERPI